MEILLEHQRTTGQVPHALKRRVILKEEDKWYWEVFHELNRSRVFGDSVGPIPESELRHYFDNNFVKSFSEREAVRRRLYRLDDEFLKFVSEKRKRELDKSKGGSR